MESRQKYRLNGVVTAIKLDCAMRLEHSRGDVVALPGDYLVETEQPNENIILDGKLFEALSEPCSDEEGE